MANQHGRKFTAKQAPKPVSISSTNQQSCHDALSKEIAVNHYCTIEVSNSLSTDIVAMTPLPAAIRIAQTVGITASAFCSGRQRLALLSKGSNRIHRQHPRSILLCSTDVAHRPKSTLGQAMASLFQPRQNNKSRHRPRLHLLLRLPLLQTLRYFESSQSGNLWTIGVVNVWNMAVHDFRDDAYEPKAVQEAR